jgi:hypothetical protein
LWAGVLPQGWDVFGPSWLVLLCQGRHAVREQVLRIGRRLPVGRPGHLWVPRRHDALRQRRGDDVLRGGPGVRTGLSLGVDVHDVEHVHQRHDDDVVLHDLYNCVPWNGVRRRNLLSLYRSLLRRRRVLSVWKGLLR